MCANKTSHILILHPDDDRVFTCDGQHLPSFASYSFSSLEVSELTRFVQEKLELPFEIVLLRRECDIPVPLSWPHCLIYIFEIPRSAVSRIGENEKWVAKEKVPQLCVEPSTDLVINYLRKYAIDGLEINTNTDRLHSFAKRGWFDRTSEWSRSILSGAGFQTGELQQLQIGIASCILRLRSQCGVTFYVKACHPTGIYNEAAVSLVLGTEMPDDFMRPLAVDLERNVLLLNDLGTEIGSTDGYESDTETDERVLGAWGKIQSRAVLKKEQLIRGGVPVWDVERFRRMLEEMVEDADWWSFQQEDMSEEERCKYDWGTCKDMCLEVSEDFWHKAGQYNVPFSLVHGDLNPGNVIVQDDSKLAFIDLSYAVWSCPLLDLLLTNFEEADEVEFYLEMWSGYESMDRLKELVGHVFAFRTVYASLRAYHIFKYSEQSRRNEARRELVPMRLFFEVNSE